MPHAHLPHLRTNWGTVVSVIAALVVQSFLIGVWVSGMHANMRALEVRADETERDILDWQNRQDARLDSLERLFTEMNATAARSGVQIAAVDREIERLATAINANNALIRQLLVEFGGARRQEERQ